MSEYIYKRNRVADGVYSSESTGEQIVRCLDCRYCVDRDGAIPLCGYWPMGDYDDSNSSHRITFYPTVSADGFCAWAERREP